MIETAGAEAAARKLPATLQSLDLGSNNLGPPGASALLRSPNLGGLTRLVLGGNDMGQAGAAALGAAVARGALDKLQELDVYANGLGGGVAELSVLTGLRSLDVR